MSCSPDDFHLVSKGGEGLWMLNFPTCISSFFSTLLGVILNRRFKRRDESACPSPVMCADLSVQTNLLTPRGSTVLLHQKMLVFPVVSGPCFIHTTSSLLPLFLLPRNFSILRTGTMMRAGFMDDWVILESIEHARLSCTLAPLFFLVTQSSVFLGLDPGSLRTGTMPDSATSGDS